MDATLLKFKENGGTKRQVCANGVNLESLPTKNITQ